MIESEKVIKAAWENFERFVLPAGEGFSTVQRNEMRRAFYSGYTEAALKKHNQIEEDRVAQEFAEFLDQMDKGDA